MATSLLSKRQFDPNNPPMPHGGFGYYQRPSKTWMIISASIVGAIILSFIAYCIYYNISKRRRAKAKFLKVSHQRSASGISESDPDSIKPVKRLRSFHMRGAKDVSAKSSPTTPTGSSSGGLFSRFFRKKGGHKRMPTLDEEMNNDSYANLNRYPDTPGLDEKMLETSPPPTPAPAFGWSSNAAAASKRRSMSETLGENTAYKGEARPPMGQAESDSFLSRSSSTRSEGGRGRNKRLSAQYDENYQSRPSDLGYLDDDEDEKRPLGYNPDSRSGH